MDRFIGYFIFYKSYSAKYLKSNMDRFIVAMLCVKCICDFGFKIQYGQIYSQVCHCNQLQYNNLKSNMDRFIEFRQYTRTEH